MIRLALLSAAALALLHYADRFHARLEIAACTERGWLISDCETAFYQGYRLPTRTSPRVEL